MKKCFFKVYKNLKIYNDFEFSTLVNKLLLQKPINCFYYKPKKNYFKTFCLETGVKRSVYNFFNLSRWGIKKLIMKAEICGLKKISW